MALSPREKQCLTLLAQGQRLQAVAQALGIHIKTVDKHLLSARIKLKAQTTEHAIVVSLQNGLLSK